MLAEILLETFKFCSRWDLDAAELVSRQWYRTIDSQHEQLPLRSFHSIEIVSGVVSSLDTCVYFPHFQKEETDGGHHRATDKRPTEYHSFDNPDGPSWEGFEDYMVEYSDITFKLERLYQGLAPRERPKVGHIDIEESFW